MELLIIRHGQASHNLGAEQQHLFAGRVDNVLTSAGVKTAFELARKIKEQGRCDIVAASKLKRSLQTAEIIAREMGVPLKIIPNLKEVDVGKFAGLNEKEVRDLYPQESAFFYLGQIKKWHFPCGEDYEKINKRMDSAIEEILHLPEDFKTVVVVGHAMLNRVLFYNFLPAKKYLWENRSYPHDRIIKIKIN